MNKVNLFPPSQPRPVCLRKTAEKAVVAFMDEVTAALKKAIRFPSSGLEPLK